LSWICPKGKVVSDLPCHLEHSVRNSPPFVILSVAAFCVAKSKDPVFELLVGILKQKLL